MMPDDIWSYPLTIILSLPNMSLDYPRVSDRAFSIKYDNKLQQDFDIWLKSLYSLLQLYPLLQTYKKDSEFPVQ